MNEINAAQPALSSEFPLRPIEVFSVLSAAGLVLVHLARFALTTGVPGWPTLVAVAAGLLAADFVSGVIHWAGDTWGNEGTFWIGPRFIRPFRFHHAQPMDMLGSHFFTTNGDTALASLPFLLIPFALPLDTQAVQATSIFLWTVGAWGMWTHQFHKWAHMKSAPRVVRFLQRVGLILRPAHHRRHHRSPFAINYCITTGWCNPVLTRIRFFPALEHVVSWLTGWRPRGEPKPTIPTAVPAARTVGIP
jgi:ubiquitin-conjugating enzyme E2 variant